MGLIIFFLLSIILLPLGFIWLNYYELSNCKSKSYEELAIINRRIDSVSNLIPEILGLISNNLPKEKNLISEITMSREFLLKLPNTFRNSKNRYNCADTLFNSMDQLLSKVNNDPTLKYMPALQKCVAEFQHLKSTFQESVIKYNSLVVKFHNYTTTFPTSIMAEKLKMICILQSFETKNN